MQTRASRGRNKDEKAERTMFSSGTEHKYKQTSNIIQHSRTILPALCFYLIG